MDISDYRGILIDKIQKFEPECAEKIIERFLIDIGKQEMAMLASHHDHFIREVVLKAKMDLQNLAPNPDMPPISPPVNPQQGLSHSSIISPDWLPGYGVPSPYWDQHSLNKTNPEFMAMSSLDSITRLKQQAELLSLENQTDSVNTGTGGIAHGYFGLDASAASFGVKAGQSLSSMSGFPVKACHYFNKGFCRHGTSCRYYHGQVSESFPQIYENGAIIEDQMYSLGSLAQLETEIVELIKSKRGSPLTIAKLPTAYQDKYNRLLQFDGYLTESQRHGKSGYNLTKLLARLKNSIRLILRPNGQHAVVLAEDAPKYIQKGDFGQNISASRQIYLTFPAESTFTEEDVSNYFNTTFGTVEDVRIPCQQRRMFGFVTFVDPETVKTILDKGNPHYVSGSRVLVKPYREKAKVVDRKFPDRIDHPVYHSPHYVVMDSEFPLISRTRGNHSFITREQELEKAFDLKRTALAELQFGRNDLSVSPQFGFSMDGSRASDDASNFKPLGSFSFALIEKPKPTDSNPSDENSSQGLNLQDSPFAFPRASGI